MTSPSQETQAADELRTRCQDFADTDDGLVMRVKGGENDGQVIRLQSQKCSIGSSPACTLRLVSNAFRPVHCVILRGRQGTVVRRWDHGTRLNGNDFLDEWLVPGDRLSIGEVDFEVLSDRLGLRAPAANVLGQKNQTPDPVGEQGDFAAETAATQLSNPVEHPPEPPTHPSRRPQETMQQNALRESAVVASQLDVMTVSLAAAEVRRRDTRRRYRVRVSQLTGRLRAATRQTELWRDKVTHQEQQIQKLIDQNTELEDHLRNQIADARRQAETLVDQVATAEQREQQLESRHETLLEQLQALEDQHHQLVAEHAELEAKRSQLVTELDAEREAWAASLAKQSDQLRNEICQSQAGLNQQLNELRLERDQLLTENQRIAASMEQAQHAQSEADQLRAEHERLQNEAATHEERRVELEQQLKTLEAEKDAYLAEAKQRAAELADARINELMSPPPQVVQESERRQRDEAPSLAEVIDADDLGESQISVREEEVSFTELDSTAPNDTASILARYAPNLYKAVETPAVAGHSPRPTPSVRESPIECAPLVRNDPVGDVRSADEVSHSDDEDSIHDYMSALMQRMGGVIDRQPTPEQEPPQRRSSSRRSTPPSSPELLPGDQETSGEMVPRAKRPVIDLAAMRDVANTTARHNISRHQFRMSFQDALVNWCLACCGFIIAIGMLYWSNRIWSLKAAEALFAMCCGVYWTIKGFGCYSIFLSDDAAKKFEEVSKEGFRG